MRTLAPGANVAGKITDATGVSDRLKTAGAAADQVQHLATKHVIDPVLGDVAKSTIEWALEHLKEARSSLKPTFSEPPGGQRINGIRPSHVSPSGRSTDPGTRPLRMFNLRTGNLEDTGGRTNKYAILSHGWNGKEIEISDFKDVRKKWLKNRMPPTFSTEGLELDQDTELPRDVDLILRYYNAEVTRLRTAKAGSTTISLSQQEATAIQKRASAHKIWYSFQRARELFRKELGYTHISELDEYMKTKGDLFLWNDTCCIDKTALTEAANSIASMGEWYINAEFCIVHLCHDPLWLNPAPDTVKNDKKQPEYTWTADFRSNENEPLTITRSTNYEWLDDLLPRRGDDYNYKQPYWTKRGWTLQELCLSRRAYYFNNKWGQLVANPASGDNGERERRIIASVSGVPQSEVCRGAGNSAVSAFELLGFASHRQCTVPVDRIYSTMGMLGVKFLTFNAEGPCMALNRLLDHVVSLSRDVSVFNWSGVNCGSTIPGRSLYPASLEPFKERSQTAQINHAIQIQHLQKQTLQSLNSSTTIEELMALDPSQGSMFNPAPSAGNVSRKPHLIDWSLERFAWFVSSVEYSSLPIDAINKILNAISNMEFDRRFSYEYVLLRRLLRFVQRDNQRGDEQGRAIEALKGTLTETRDTEPSDPPPPYPPPLPNTVENPTLPIEEPMKPQNQGISNLLPNQGISGFGMKKFGLGKTKGKAPVPEAPVVEKPVAEKPKSRFSSLLSRDSVSAPEEGKSNISNQDQGKEGEVQDSTQAMDPNWYTIVDNIVDYITSSSRLLSQTNDLYSRHRLFYIGKILDALFLHSRKGSPKVEIRAVYDSPLQRPAAKYLPQIIANRALCFVVESENPTNVTDVLNMLQVLTYIGHTRFEELSPSHIGDLLDLLNRTRFRVCPSYAEIQKIHEKHDSPLCGDPDPKRWLFNNDCDEDDEDVETRKDELPGPMISPNPLIVSTSGIEGLFDIQRVVVDILNAAPVEPDEVDFRNYNNPDIEGLSVSSAGKYEYDAGTYTGVTGTCLYHSLQTKISEGRGDARYTGNCLISTGLSQTTVGFSSTARLLMKQLELRDVISQTELKEHSAQNRNVQEMLRFVKERDIELVAGEWVLARFAGVPGAHWFLCLLELGDTHPYYGWRIPTDLIDFSQSTYEPRLVELWHGYMKEKSKLLCKWIEQRLRQRKVALDKKGAKRDRDDNDVKLWELGVGGTMDVMTGRSTVVGAMTEGAHKIGRMVEADVTHLMIKKDEYDLKQEEYQGRLDLRSKALNAAGIEKDEHAAVLSLDDNSVLPTMYFPSMRVHMF